MYYRIILPVLFTYSVFSDDDFTFHLSDLHPVIEKPMVPSPEKRIDIYTNHRDFREVVDSYYKATTTRPNHRRFERLPDVFHVFKHFTPQIEKISPMQLENSIHLDRIDFHYPSTGTSDELESSFGSFKEPEPDQNRYVLLQSQKVVPDENDESHKYKRKRKPASPNYNSHIQRIPRTTTTTTTVPTTKINLPAGNSTTGTRKKINQLLKRYLAKLYERKYNSSSNALINTSARLEQEQKTKKFLDANYFLNLKNKTLNKIKLFSLFTIVQFNNTQCSASSAAGDYQGVCYTAAQCTTEGGTALGNCASGYGVCCVFKGTCGGTGNQNCTYFQSPNYPDYYPPDGSVVVPTTESPLVSTNLSPTPDPRLPWNSWGRQNEGNYYSCIFSVNKLNDNISKMRIDFEDLELTGPTNGTCSDERLVISGQNTNNQVPVICGYNTGQHVYVDVSSLSGPLQVSVLSASGARKRFKIKICQFGDTCLEPSSNCLQYFTGVSGVISSFNYDMASMLPRSVPGYFNNLNYAICIRREEGYCSVTYRNVANGVEYPFQFTNVDDSGSMIILPGQAGADIFNCPDDYIVIDGTRLCGDKFNDGSIEDFTMNADVTDTGAGPIVIPVRTDSMVTGMGFKLFYMQNPCIDF